MSVLVFGSSNLDLVSRSPRLPLPGETIIGSQFFTTPGGKGANQAVAIARLGIPTQMIGRVGGDAFGKELLSALQAANVNTSGVIVDRSTHSGVAVITVADSGENQIIGVLGANDRLDHTDVARLVQQFSNADALLLQLEIPIPIVKAAAQAAHKAGIPVMLDPAPAPPVSIADLYPFIDFLVPNEVEAGQLVGFPVHSPDTATRAAKRLREQGVKTAIVKLGAQGVICATENEIIHLPAFPVEAIDTVAAGDAFAGGFAAALVTGLPLTQALTWGSAAGALATTKVGAQTAMPDRETFDAFLKQHGVRSGQ